MQVRLVVTNVKTKLDGLGISPENTNELSSKILSILPTCQQWSYNQDVDELELYIEVIIPSRILELGEVDQNDYTMG